MGRGKTQIKHVVTSADFSTLKFPVVSSRHLGIPALATAISRRYDSLTFQPTYVGGAHSPTDVRHAEPPTWATTRLHETGQVANNAGTMTATEEKSGSVTSLRLVVYPLRPVLRCNGCLELALPSLVLYQAGITCLGTPNLLSRINPP